jgi:hypothetical protein
MAKTKRNHGRSAAATLEFILVLPFVVVLLLATAQFSVALLMRNAVTQAAAVAAREAGKGEDVQEAGRAVDAVLERAHSINVADVDTATDPATAVAVPNSGVRVLLEVGQPDAAGRPAESDFGDLSLSCSPPASPPLQADQVRVTVCFDLSTRPMSNWLFSFDDGLVNFNNRRFQISSLAKKE